MLSFAQTIVQPRGACAKLAFAVRVPLIVVPSKTTDATWSSTEPCAGLHERVGLTATKLADITPGDEGGEAISEMCERSVPALCAQSPSHGERLVPQKAPESIQSVCLTPQSEQSVPRAQ